MTPELLFAVAIVLIVGVALLASELDAWRLRRKAAKRQAQFHDDHRDRTPLAGFAPPPVRPRQAFPKSTSKERTGR